MGRIVRIYKRIIDVSLLVSFGLLLLLVILLLYGVFTQAYNFTDQSLPMILDRTLEISIIANVVGVAVFVTVARVFLSLMNKVENLETVEDYRKKIKRHQTTIESFSESQIYQELNKKREQIVIEEDVIDGQLSFAEEIHMVEHGEDPEVVVEEKEIDVEPAEVVMEDSEDLVTSVEVEATTEKLFYTRMNKGEIIELVAKASNLSTYKSRKFLNAMLDIITEELIQDNDVKIEEFGRFKKQLVKEKVSINPQTQERLIIEEHNTVKFTPYKKFKELITEDVIATSDRYLLTDTVKRDLSEDELQNELIKENNKQKHVAKKLKNSKR